MSPSLPLIAVGIDWAWSPYKPSGVCVAHITPELKIQVLKLQCVVGLEPVLDLVDFALAQVPEGSRIAVAVDAPLIAKGKKGDSRRADNELSAHFHRAQAGAYAANRHTLDFGTSIFSNIGGYNVTEQLYNALRMRKFVDFPADPQSPKLMAEVYPHPAMVNLFDLANTLKYKKHRGKEKLDSLLELQQMIYGLTAYGLKMDHGHPLPLDLTPIVASGAASRVSNHGLKHIEDKLDALFCAFIAGMLLVSPDNMHVYGGEEWATGYIVVPNKQ